MEVDAKVELWMARLVDGMKASIRNLFWRHLTEGVSNSRKAFEKDKLLGQIKGIPGQILIGMAQISWTTDVKMALQAIDTGNKAVMK